MRADSPTRRTRGRRGPAAGWLAATLAAAILVGCSPTPSSTPTPSPSASATPDVTPPPVGGPNTPAASAAFGAGCPDVPLTGPSSAEGTVGDPTSEALKAYPALTTLVAALRRAGLISSLDSASKITVFAPNNDAFQNLDGPTVLRARKARLSAVLRTHFVEGRIAPDNLVGPHLTRSGTTIELTGSGTDYVVDGTARIVCGNLRTANATIYVIDHILLPH